MHIDDLYLLWNFRSWCSTSTSVFGNLVCITPSWLKMTIATERMLFDTVVFSNPKAFASQWARDIVMTSVFLLDLYRDIVLLRIETEVTWLYDIFFRHHNDVVAIFNIVLISDKLYGKIIYKKQIETSNFIQVSASLVFVAILEFWFSRFCRLTIYKLIATLTAFLIAVLIKIDNKKPDQIISRLLTFRKHSTCSFILFCTCGTFLNIPRGYLHYNW